MKPREHLQNSKSQFINENQVTNANHFMKPSKEMHSKEQTMDRQEIKANIEQWRQENEANEFKVTIGLDDWHSEFETIFDKDVFFANDDDIIDVLIEYQINAYKLGEFLNVAWLKGCLSPDCLFRDPKSLLRIGAGKQVGLIIQKASRIKEIEGKAYEYQPYIGPMSAGQQCDETQNENAPDGHYEDVLTPAGIKNVKQYLATKIPSEIKNRLVQLKVAGEDYKAEATQLKREITRIVKELE